MSLELSKSDFIVFIFVYNNLLMCEYQRNRRINLFRLL